MIIVVVVVIIIIPTINKVFDKSYRNDQKDATV
jgi:hypothetical protein